MGPQPQSPTWHEAQVGRRRPGRTTSTPRAYRAVALVDRAADALATAVLGDRQRHALPLAVAIVVASGAACPHHPTSAVAYVHAYGVLAAGRDACLPGPLARDGYDDDDVYHDDGDDGCGRRRHRLRAWVWP